MKLLDLFAGIGGFSLGLESTGYFKTIAFVEKDEFCQKVLKKNFKNIPIESEVRNVKGEKYKNTDVITAGFPCQPFSIAGKRKGTMDDRYLWDETIRIIKEVKPRWFIGENVDGIVNIQEGMVLRQVQDDLEKEGFQVQCLVIPAAGIGAWHQRKRVWIIGNSEHNGLSSTQVKRGNIETSTGSSKRQEKTMQFERTNGPRNDGYVPDTKRNEYKYSTSGKSGAGEIWGFCSKKEKQTTHDLRSEASRRNSSFKQETWWQTQSRICGVPAGLSERMDKDRKNRIKALGNTIVPQIARELGLAIAKAEGL